jgi:hypothetical protein
MDLSKADDGEDASYPAFRVPFQGLDEDNHRAYWTLDIGDTGGGGAGGAEPCPQILGLGDPCDPLDDCCETGSYCDSLDSGDTFHCIDDVPR